MADAENCPGRIDGGILQAVPGSAIHLSIVASGFHAIGLRPCHPLRSQERTE